MATNMNISKAELVKQACDAAQQENLYSKDCHARAINAAVALGGIEILTINTTETCTSKVIFEFDDCSRVLVKYGIVSVIYDDGYSAV